MSRHPLWYFPDGSSIFKVEDVLYKLHPHLLCNVSETIQSMFHMPSSEQCEGLTDSLPIHFQLPVTPWKFECLLEWFYSQYSHKSAADFTLEALDAVLELSSFFMIESGRTFAINEMRLRSLSPSTKLIMGQKHPTHLADWISAAIRELLALPSDSLTYEDYQTLGLHNTYTLLEVRAKISNHRQTVAFTAPSIQHDYGACLRLRDCSEGWVAAWWGGFARHYIHPDRRSTPDEALTKLANAQIVNVTSECQKKTVDRIAESGVLLREEEFIEQAITSCCPSG
ncbi:hypothetical protein K439DRAFT_1624656 [Ramaria rubella]|nr:hypothetical protein K439DRAFT_1624656 [Ramaria rubella]